MLENVRKVKIHLRKIYYNIKHIHFGETASWWNINWWNDKLMKWQVDEMTSWWNDKLMKWQVDEMTSWWNDKLIKWQVDEMTSWQNSKLKNAKRQNVKLT